jgi:hypothetical protein
MDQEKRRFRQMKRDVKRAGNRKRRHHLKRELAEDPDEAARTEFDFGRDSSATFNGNDNDSTRRRNQRREEEE